MKEPEMKELGIKEKEQEQVNLFDLIEDPTLTGVKKEDEKKDT
jgi:hypothetical protein